MILVLKSDTSQQAELANLIAQQHDPQSPQFHHFLTPEDFAAHFGVSDSDIAKVTSWLSAQGFKIDEIPAGRRSILFSGTSDQVSRAFATEIRQYTVNGEVHHANSSDPRLPPSLADLATGIVKLHDFRHAPSVAKKTQISSMVTPTPQMTSGSSHYLSPADYGTIYNISPLYASGIDGTGQSIAIVARSNISLSDVQSFRQLSGLAANNPQVILVNNDPGLAADMDEALLDTEWAGAVAPKATVKLVVASSTNSADGVDLSAQYIVNHNLAPVMSVSYGACEAYMGAAELSFYNNLWQQAAAQGITVFVSSGDSGAAGCSPASASTGTMLGVNGLCSSPYSVCVGGTQFSEGSNPGQYWLAGNNSVLGSAISYIPEVVWNESGANGGTALWAGGGGASSIYPKPSWQAGPGMLADGRRDVPDVSLTAAGHDGYLVVASGSLWVISGTSASSPSFAGMMALVNQKTGIRQGNANTVLYPLAARQAQGGTAIFHDIVAGNNSVPGVTGITAKTSYDAVTGLGSVNAAQMVNHWNDLTVQPGFTLSASKSTLSVQQSQTGTAVITSAITGGFNAVVSLTLTGVPTGVTATLAASSFAAPGSGTVSLSIAPSRTAVPGTYNLVVTGKSGLLTSTAAIALTITAAPPALSATAAPATMTLGLGQSGSGSVNVVSGGSFNSAVTMSLTGAPTGVSVVFSPSQLTAPGSGTIFFTLAVGKSVTPGTYVLTLKAQGGGLTATSTVSLTIPAAATLSLSLSPAALTVQQGQSASSTLTVTGGGSFKSAVSLLLSGVPSGMTAALSTSTIASPGSGTTIIRVSPSLSTTSGSYTLTITAQGAGLTVKIPLTVMVTAAPSFTITPTASSVTVSRSHSGSVRLSMTSLNGFNSTVAFSLSGMPTGVTSAFSPTSLPGVGGSTTLTLPVAATAKTGLYQMVITATGGGVTVTTPFFVNVTL